MFSLMKVTLAFMMMVMAARGAKEMVTPVQKVTQLLQGMVEKGKKEKHEEAVQFAAYKQFCEDTVVEKQNAIKEANDVIGTLKADIQKYEADAAQLTKEIAEHEEDISEWNGDLKAAKKVRQNERADYDKTHKDYSESVDALERAIEVIKKQSGDIAQFTQVEALKSLDSVPQEAKQAIDTFLDDTSDENLAVSAPEANAYESQSGGIIEMLQKLLDKFFEERTALEREEANTRHAYEMVKSDLEGQIEQATQARDEKAETKAQKKQSKAEAEAELDDTTSTRDDDMKYLEDLTATCEQKSSDFESRQQLRGEELEAIEKAIEIIEKGTSLAQIHLAGQTQGASFAQLRADS